MATKTARPSLLTDVVRQRRKVERLRDQHRDATLRLAEMLVEVRDADDPDLTLIAAARAMGISKQNVQSIIGKLDR